MTADLPLPAMGNMVITELNGAADALRHCAFNGTKERVCYTAIIGEYDTLCERKATHSDVEFVCFTDRLDFRPNGWRVVTVDFTYRDPRRTARLFKFLPHLLFPGCDWSLWIDGNFEASEDFIQFALQHTKPALVCFKHPARACLYKEAKACISKGKDDSDLIRRQIQHYRAEGMPEKLGLIASGIIARRHHDDAVIRLSMDWLRQVDEHSARDQIAFPFVAWRQGVRYESFACTMAEAPGLRYRPHSKWIFYDRTGKRMRSARAWIWKMYYRLRVKLRRGER